MVVHGMADAPLIAIVDDDVTVCEATRGLVEAFGFSARTFTSAGEFLNSDCVSSTACLISDVQMPGMNGLQLHSKLLASGGRFPVIFITASKIKGLRRTAEKLGAIAFFEKPYDSEQLLAAVRQGLNAKPAARKNAAPVNAMA